MARYRILRDFGSHLGNHHRGEYITLPDGPLPRGFAGFVEVAKRVLPAADLPPTPADGAPAGTQTPLSEPADGDGPPAKTGPAYDDKMLRPAANTGHGHVHPRPDGVRARCGGPAICKQCALEAGKLPGRRR